LAGLPYLDGVTVEVVPEQVARLALLRSGKLELAHWWGFLSPDDGKALQKTNPEMVITPTFIADGMFYPGAPWNRSRVDDPELSKMLLAQRRELDPKKRKEIGPR
jgi:ABC-type transport system substrate-binding protein